MTFACFLQNYQELYSRWHSGIQSSQGQTGKGSVFTLTGYLLGGFIFPRAIWQQASASCWLLAGDRSLSLARCLSPLDQAHITMQERISFQACHWSQPAVKRRKLHTILYFRNKNYQNPYQELPVAPQHPKVLQRRKNHFFTEWGAHGANIKQWRWMQSTFPWCSLFPTSSDSSGVRADVLYLNHG